MEYVERLEQVQSLKVKQRECMIFLGPKKKAEFWECSHNSIVYGLYKKEELVTAVEKLE